MFLTARFFPWVKGKEILEVTARLFGINGQRRNHLIEEKSIRIGFDPALLERRVQTYSLGNQKKNVLPAKLNCLTGALDCR